MIRLPFKNRAEAGTLLGAQVEKYRFANPIVLALPRGGVPIGFAVATSLEAPLDVVVVRKIGVPWQPELAMGAIAGERFLSLDYEMVRHFGISREQIEKMVARERAELQRREKLYRGDRASPDLRSRTAVLVDDGLATGSTMLVAVRYVRSLKPAEIVIAVPVASNEAASRASKEADLFVCLATPQPFRAVGEWYMDFEQTSDAEVQTLLQQHSRAIEAAKRTESSRE